MNGYINFNATVCVLHSAFDTLAKVLNPAETEIAESLVEKSRCASGTTIRLIGRDQETPIIEVEGPLLTDSHVSFKVIGLLLVVAAAVEENSFAHPPNLHHNDLATSMLVF